MGSLERRLQIGLALSLLLLVASFWTLGHYTLHRLMEEFILSRLQHDTEAVLAAFKIGGDGLPKVGWQRLTPIYNQPFSGHYYVLETSDGERVLSRSLWDQDLAIPKLPPGRTAHWERPGPNGQQLLIWAGGYRKLDHDFTLAVAEDVAPLAEKLRRFEWLFAAIALTGLLLLLGVQRLVIHKGFLRLLPVFADMQRLEQGEAICLSEDVPSEIFPLVHKFNGLLRLLHQRLERSRNAVGNLMHALKGPLSLLQQRIDASDLDPHPRLRATLSAQTGRIQALMNRELKRARMAGAGSPGRMFDPGAEIPPLIEVLKRIYDDQRLRIECRLDPVGPQSADREDLLELLGNLLDNACKWARTRVYCSARKTAAGLEYSIEDDGPGCGEQVLERIQQRGVRLDENVEGHGLGLAIARDIVDLYDGRLQLDRSPKLGGFRARVLMPGA